MRGGSRRRPARAGAGGSEIKGNGKKYEEIHEARAGAGGPEIKGNGKKYEEIHEGRRHGSGAKRVQCASKIAANVSSVFLLNSHMCVKPDMFSSRPFSSPI